MLKANLILVMIKNSISTCLKVIVLLNKITEQSVLICRNSKCVVFFLFSIFFCAFSFNGYGQDKKQLIRQGLDILKKYDSQGTYIVRCVQNMPSNYNLCGVKISFYSAEKVENYLTKNTFQDILWQLPTLVHEFNHEYTGNPYQYMQKNNICDAANKYYTYFLDTNQTNLVRLSKTFPSKRIYDYIQKNNLVTFRVSTYINGNSSTQSNGIFGLLDEMNAYRTGAITLMSFSKYYMDTQGSYDKWIIEYLRNTQSNMMAYLEFKFFILCYLIYAQENEREVYANLIANIPFIKTFLYVEQSFQKVVKEYIAFYTKAISEMQSKGIAVSNDSNSEFISVNGYGTILLEKDKEYKKLTEELKKSKYQKIMDNLLSKAKQ